MSSRRRSRPEDSAPTKQNGNSTVLTPIVLPAIPEGAGSTEKIKEEDKEDGAPTPKKQKIEEKEKDHTPKRLFGKQVSPDIFEIQHYFYEKVLNSQCHPMVTSFMNLGNERIAQRYCHLNPRVKASALKDILSTTPKIFRWSGADLFNVTNASGRRQMIIIETNSCPSGQKSMPMSSDHENTDGYHVLMKSSFWPLIEEKQKRGELPKGGLAVIYDKNEMEAKGYAAAFSNVAQEPVWLAEFHEKEQDADPPFRWTKDGILQVRDEKEEFHDIRAAFRYVTQRPWTRIPLNTKTLILNPIVACLAGGRNKWAAASAYGRYNAELASTGLAIRTPDTSGDVSKSAIRLEVEKMGGRAVIKVPYSNAGQGVYTITNNDELLKFEACPTRYDKFIVQSLVGNSTWSSTTSSGAFFHTGTIPDRKGNSYVSDLRMMIVGTAEGYKPIAIYSRRARQPLAETLNPGMDSWEMLGTNLSVKHPDGSWGTDTTRLVLMDMKDFNRLGLGVDDLIDAYVQTVLATTAIDRLAERLTKDDHFDFKVYEGLNDDLALLDEIVSCNPELRSEYSRYDGSVTSPYGSSSLNSSGGGASSSGKRKSRRMSSRSS